MERVQKYMSEVAGKLIREMGFVLVSAEKRTERI
jgi:hypothetical protein